MSSSFDKNSDTIWDSWLRPIIDFAAFPIDTTEDATKFTIKADLPGVNKSDVSVTHLNHSVHIRAHRKCQEKTPTEFKTWKERPCGDMERVIRLPSGIDESSMTASLDNGVLTLTATKTQSSSQKINIL